jgi:phosphonate transport system substrate-binding protein
MRFTLLVALALWAGALSAQDWRQKYPVVGMSAVSSESQGATEARFKDFARLFKERLGAELKIYTASDYAGTVQALTSGQIHFASLGPAAYASAWIDSNGQVEPLAAAKEPSGDVGYHAHLIVKADSGYRGSGDHEQSALGVVKGQFDAAFVWGARNPLDRGVLRAMTDRGILDPKLLRVVWMSPLIPNSPITVRKDLPADMKADIRKLFLELQSIDPKMAETVVRGKTQGYVEVTHAMYQPILDAVQEQRKARRRQ